MTLESQPAVARAQHIHTLRQQLAEDKSAEFEARGIAHQAGLVFRDAKRRLIDLEDQHPDAAQRSATVKLSIAHLREQTDLNERAFQAAEAQLKTAESTRHATEAALADQRNISFSDLQGYEQGIATLRGDVERLAKVEQRLLAELEPLPDDGPMATAEADYQRVLAEHAQDRATPEQVQQAQSALEKARATFAKQQAKAQAARQSTEHALIGLRRQRQQVQTDADFLETERLEWTRLLIEALWDEALGQFQDAQTAYTAALSRCRMLQEGFYKRGGTAGAIGGWNPSRIDVDLIAARAVEQQRLAAQGITLTL